MSEILPDLQAKHIQIHYVCAVCWSHLVCFHDGTLTRVECAKYGALHSGFHSKSYATQTREASHWDRIDAMNNLGALLGIKTTRRTPEEILKDLYGG